jgi:hypothetical protein
VRYCPGGSFVLAAGRRPLKPRETIFSSLICGELAVPTAGPAGTGEKTDGQLVPKHGYCYYPPSNRDIKMTSG